MRSYAWLMLGMCVLFLALFGVVEALHVPLLTDPRPWLGGSKLLAAGVGVGLLVADVLLPVPASLVMVAHGALFGVVAGTLLSLLGSLGAAAFGFYLGRAGSPLLGKVVPEGERQRGDALLRDWGSLAVVVTRPVPILAEAVAILAGTSPLPWGRFLLAAAAGSLPPSLLYALTGATAADLDSFLLIFGLVLGLAGVLWWAGRRWGRGLPRELSSRPRPATASRTPRR